MTWVKHASNTWLLCKRHGRGCLAVPMKPPLFMFWPLLADQAEVHGLSSRMGLESAPRALITYDQSVMWLTDDLSRGSDWPSTQNQTWEVSFFHSLHLLPHHSMEQESTSVTLSTYSMWVIIWGVIHNPCREVTADNSHVKHLIYYTAIIIQSDVKS